MVDANLIATGLMSDRGPAGALIAAARIGRFEMIVSEYLIDEVRDTLVNDSTATPVKCASSSLSWSESRSISSQ